jgi:hypothetical protein
MNNLFKIVFLLGFIFSLTSKAQSSSIPQLKPYEDISSKLYTSKVIEISGKSKKELQNTFKNWAATAFNNLREVMVSETENQIVLVYITEVPVVQKLVGIKVTDIWPLYVRFVAEFKDDKIRVSLYDDGNSLYAYFPPRSIYISNYSTPPNTKKELTKRDGSWYLAHTVWQEKCDLTIASVDNGMKNPTATSPKRKDDF